MFKRNQKQYVNIFVEDGSIRICNKIFKDNKLLKTEVSSFLLQDQNSMPSDVLSKLEILQKNIPQTYLTSLYLSQDQRVLQKEYIDTTTANGIMLDGTNFIVSKKTNIVKSASFFKNSGIDYLVSPFSVLFYSIKNDLIQNSLNLLIYDNLLYILVVDNDKNIVYGIVKPVTKLDDIRESEFYNNSDIGLQIYDEILFLEVEQILSETIQEYYKQNSNVDFIQEINILYVKEFLNDDQLDSLSETLMSKINYHQISIENILFDIVQDKDILNYSFIKPREKKNINSMALWISIAVITSILALGTLYFKLKSDEKDNKIDPKVEQKLKEAVKEIKEKKAILKKQLLPNHRYYNNQLIDNILTIFDLIPYDAVLQDIKFSKDETKVVVNFVKDSHSIDKLKTQFLKLFKDVKIMLKHTNKKSGITNVIFELKGIKDNYTLSIKKDIEYKKQNYLQVAQIISLVKSLVLSGSAIKLISKDTKDFEKYIFNISSTIKSPKEFFDILESINKKNISIHISKPLEFKKEANSIKISYKLEYYQYKQKGTK